MISSEIDQYPQLSFLDGISTFERVSGGKNNKTFKVSASSGDYFVKHFFNDKSDKRDRYGHELWFLDYCQGLGCEEVPKSVRVFPNEQIIVTEAIQGQIIKQNEVNKNHVIEAACFIRKINKGMNQSTSFVPNAVESCTRLVDHVNLVRTRYDLMCSNANASNEFSTLIKDLKCWADKIWRFLGGQSQEFSNRWEQELGVDDLIISPSDYGFHNCLVDQDGKMRFFDFEYAGLDDPAKLVVDFFNQPRIPVPLIWLNNFVEILGPTIKNVTFFHDRIKILFPLYSLKWVCIMLGEFYSETSERRKFSQTIVGNHQARQCAKVRKYIFGAKDTFLTPEIFNG